MNAPIRISEETLRRGDRQFLRQLKTASRAQLKAMLAVFEQLAPDGGPLAWKRAAVQRKLGIERVSFDWLERDEWWLEAKEEEDNG